MSLARLARMPAYTVESLDGASEGDRSLVRTRAMRNSVYTLPRDLLAVALPATRKGALRGYASVRRKLGDDYPILVDRVEHALEERPAALDRMNMDEGSRSPKPPGSLSLDRCPVIPTSAGTSPWGRPARGLRGDH